MSILHIALGVLGVGGVGGIVAGLIFAPGVVLPILRAALQLASDAFAWLLKHPAWAVAIACAIFAGLQWQDARHWKKADANDIAGRHELALVLGGVKAEVDRGVGKPTRADQAAFYVRRFVDNVVTLKRGLDREEAGIRQSAKDAVDVRAGAHLDAQLTTAERQRDRVRGKIADPARTTGLSAQEWSQL